MIQLNTPYPATAYLTGFLRQHAERLRVTVTQADPAIDLFLRIFSRRGIQQVLDELRERAAALHRQTGKSGKSGKRGGRARARTGAGAIAPEPPIPASIAHFLEHGDGYVATVDAVVRFLQGRDPGLALRIAGRAFLPEGPRFAAATATARTRAGRRPLAWAFGALGTADSAKHLASLYIDDLADVVRDGIDPRFELSRYGERLAASAPTFDPLAAGARGAADAGRRAARRDQPRALVRRAPPGPGRADRALPRQRLRRASASRGRSSAAAPADAHRARRRLRQHRAAPARRAARLRLRRLHHARRRRAPAAGADRAPRAIRRRRSCARSCATRRARVRCAATPTCTTSRCATPARRPTTGCRSTATSRCSRCSTRCIACGPTGRWNKLTVAHGCYWKKCTFCDITLDYIARYDLGVGRPARRSHRGAHRRDRADRLSLRRRGRAARRAARARRAADRAQGGHHLVGQHPLREDVHARRWRSCWRARAASRVAAGSRSRPIGCCSS